MAKNIMTAEGLKKLEDELAFLKVTRRAEIAQKIKEAREQGDLSENAEYDAAKEEQRHIEDRIAEIDKILKTAEVVTDDQKEEGIVNLGSFVKVHDVEFDEDIEYKIVGVTEVNSLQNLISNESPVGKAFLGHKAGDTVYVETPAGVSEYKILQVTNAQ